MKGNSPDEPPQPGPVSEGGICDPLNISSADQSAADAAQLACQAIGTTAEYKIPGAFVNAQKGDLILSPGGASLIAALLRHVSPPQKYSHNGIMTRNFDEITHSTTSEDRLSDHRIGFEGSDGFSPIVLKYQWPGAITQTVEGATHVETWVDPQHKTYTANSFNRFALGLPNSQLPAGFEIVPPLVVKPDPLQETIALRATLHGIADEAASLAGRFDTNGNLIKPLGTHYRFYCYTDPSIGLTGAGVPAAEAGWAANTLPTVCSSLIWLCAQRRSISLEAKTKYALNSDLEPADIAQGAQVFPGTLDGLYGYTKEERRAVAQWLFDTVSSQVGDLEKWGFLAEAATDAKDNYANQIVNTFASDKTESDGGDDWKQTGDASAISPDNIIFWDSPSQGGVYGYVEPALYREPRIETYTVCQWVKVLRFGHLSGTVTINGAPAVGAHVFVYGTYDAVTDDNGYWSVPHLGLGKYSILARKSVPLGNASVNYQAQQAIDLQTDSLVVNLDLQPPQDRYRLLRIETLFAGNDDESWPWSDETDDEGPFHYELELNPVTRIQNQQKIGSFHWGGEVSCDFNLSAALLADGGILVTVVGELWEGTGVTHADEHFAGSTTVQMTVPKDGSQVVVCAVTNTVNDTDDSGTLTIVATNNRNVV
jgi:hypothetical protein